MADTASSTHPESWRQAQETEATLEGPLCDQNLPPYGIAVAAQAPSAIGIELHETGHLNETSSAVSSKFSFSGSTHELTSTTSNATKAHGKAEEEVAGKDVQYIWDDSSLQIAAHAGGLSHSQHITHAETLQVDQALSVNAFHIHATLPKDLSQFERPSASDTSSDRRLKKEIKSEVPHIYEEENAGWSNKATRTLTTPPDGNSISVNGPDLFKSLEEGSVDQASSRARRILHKRLTPSVTRRWIGHAALAVAVLAIIGLIITLSLATSKTLGRACLLGVAITLEMAVVAGMWARDATKVEVFIAMNLILVAGIFLSSQVDALHEWDK